MLSIFSLCYFRLCIYKVSDAFRCFFIYFFFSSFPLIKCAVRLYLVEGPFTFWGSHVITKMRIVLLSSLLFNLSLGTYWIWLVKYSHQTFTFQSSLVLPCGWFIPSFARTCYLQIVGPLPNHLIANCFFVIWPAFI